jgi:hypothetical protein
MGEICQAWQYTSGIPAPRRLRKEDYRFKDETLSQNK